MSTQVYRLIQDGQGSMEVAFVPPTAWDWMHAKERFEEGQTHREGEVPAAVVESLLPFVQERATFEAIVGKGFAINAHRVLNDKAAFLIAAARSFWSVIEAMDYAKEHDYNVLAFYHGEID